MAKEFTSVGSEYQVPRELSLPPEHLEPAPDIFVPAEEYITPPQYGESSAAAAAAQNGGAHKRFLRKLVYGLSSAVMVAALAVGAMPESVQSGSGGPSQSQSQPAGGQNDFTGEETARPNAGIGGDISEHENEMPLCTIELNHIRIDWYHDGEVECYNRSTKDPISLSDIPNFDIDTNNNAIYFDDFDDGGTTRLHQIFWMSKDAPLNIYISGVCRFNGLSLTGNFFNLKGNAVLYTGVGLRLERPLSEAVHAPRAGYDYTGEKWENHPDDGSNRNLLPYISLDDGLTIRYRDAVAVDYVILSLNNSYYPIEDHIQPMLNSGEVSQNTVNGSSIEVPAQNIGEILSKLNSLEF